MISFFKARAVDSFLSTSLNTTPEEDQSDQEECELGSRCYRDEFLGEELQSQAEMMYPTVQMSQTLAITWGGFASALFIAKLAEVVQLGAGVAVGGGAVGVGVSVGTGVVFAGLGAAAGIGINYLPNLFGAEKTVGDHLGDAAIAVFGPCDTKGTFFKVGEFFGLA